ncbi:SRSF protein kinase 3-like [Dysidea avara]|uniref:SRSF protein kinase 3-like n=1 Tax=Dysidea avara TaxID=196820 RepID=UPI003325E9D2
MASRKVMVMQAKKRRSKHAPKRPDVSKLVRKSLPNSAPVPRHVSVSSNDDLGDDDEYDTTESDFSDEEEQEDPVDYCRGGYHPVQLGDIYNSRYCIIRKLGWGHFSTVWLARDSKVARCVALKVVKSAKRYTETAVDEVKLLEKIASGDRGQMGRENVIELFDQFKIHGINGTHICMVFEVLGDNLLKLIIQQKYKGLPLPTVKSITAQVLRGLYYMHTHCGIIHTDMKPENVLVTISDKEISELASKEVTSPSAVSTAPSGPRVKDPSALSKNQKKKLKKKLKKQQESSSKSEAGQKEDEASTQRSADDLMDVAQSPVLPEEMNGEKMTDVKHTHPDEDDQLHDMHDSSTNNALANPLDLKVKIVDLGNACWVDHHFTEDIQTRQYRCLEVLLGSTYGPSADIWSMACMVFELATGDYLFEPHSGADYSRDEDHIAHIIELLGPIPKSIALSGYYSQEFFNRKGELRHIKQLKPWCLYDVLIDKYKMPSKDAKDMSDFLTPMLVYAPDKRATAEQCLQHPWLSDYVTR